MAGRTGRTLMDEPAAKTFLTQLGPQIGLEGLAFNGDGVCCLEVADRFGVQIEWEPTGNALVFLSRVADAPATGREEFFRILLEANFLFQGTTGETLCLNPESGEVMLCRVFPLDTTPVSVLLEEFTFFLQTTDFWADRIQSGTVLTDSENPPPEPGPSFQIRA
jgi:hypothetical protein